MMIRKMSIAALALALAVAFSPLLELRAAALLGPGAQPSTGNLVQAAQMKKKKASKKAGKRKAGKGKKAKRAAASAKSCGVYKYSKGGKCLDARDKK